MRPSTSVKTVTNGISAKFAPPAGYFESPKGCINFVWVPPMFPWTSTQLMSCLFEGANRYVWNFSHERCNKKCHRIVHLYTYIKHYVYITVCLGPIAFRNRKSIKNPSKLGVNTINCEVWLCDMWFMVHFPTSNWEKFQDHWSIGPLTIL